MADAIVYCGRCGQPVRRVFWGDAGAGERDCACGTVAEPPDLHAVVAILEPDHTEPVRVATNADPLPIPMQVGLLRAAAAHLAQQHGLNGADCLRDFLATYPMPDTTEEGS